MTDIAALIIGIGGWDEYTAPLMDSLRTYAPTVRQVVIDNDSVNAYPTLPEVVRTPRLSYSAAINTAQRHAGPADWYIVLSNDVLCTGPFVHLLEGLGDVVVGPQLRQTRGFRYLEGWCVCVPSLVWTALGGWDEEFLVSSWEDVDFSVSAAARGFALHYRRDLPFKHLDQRQRFTIVPDYWQSDIHNERYFMAKHVGVMV